MFPLRAAAFLLALVTAAAVALPQAPAPDQPPQQHGKVLFSRDGATTSPAEPQAAAGAAPPPSPITDAARLAPTFTAYDFAIHLQPEQARIEAQLRATIRNDGPEPLLTLPLQLSSSLHFEHIREAGRELPFAVHTVGSDADHTGSLTEAAVPLPRPLAPGESRGFVVDYAGTIAPSSARLDRIGTPAALAGRSDWDRISEAFTGLRGFGSTVWYPVASLPALLGDGNRLFREIGRQEAQNSAALVSMSITSEWTRDAPTVAVLDGHAASVPAPLSLPTASFPGVTRLSLPAAVLGFAVPSFVLAARTPAVGDAEVSVAALPAHADLAGVPQAAAALLEPLFADWLGSRPAVPLEVIDLPIEAGQPAKDGDALLLSLSAEEPSQLAGELVAPLTHVYFHSPRAWLQEGVAGLMGVLWVERTEGRDKAMEALNSPRSALALAEPESPGTSPGEPLLHAQDPVYYRGKATAVLGMLRTLAGDAALAAALRAYDPARDTAADYFETVLAQSIAAQPQGGASPGAEELHSFFKDWVYTDPGLPDLTLTEVYPAKTGTRNDQWLVSVNMANSGYADAWVPLTVRAQGSATTVLVRVPARGSLVRRILMPGEPTEVDLNDGTVPEVQASTHRRLLERGPAPPF